MSDVGTWSVVADKNNKPSPNGWRENMAPSDVNDSARENMAAIKRMTLDLPYISVGGKPAYEDETTVTIADDDLDTNYAKYYTAGRAVKVKYTDDGTATEKAMIGSVVSATYEGGASTIILSLVADLPTTVTDVLVGLKIDDVTNLSGPNLLGMILPFTCEPHEMPFGMGYADGEPFDPEIYAALANLYYQGHDEENDKPIYRYGEEEIKGRWWPKKPDARGYFLRFLDDRDEDAVDDEAPRTAGSTQDWQVGSHGHTLKASTTNGGSAGTNPSATTVLGNGIYAASAQRLMWVNSSLANVDNKASIPAIGDAENRPANIALAPLLVMHGGYASADQITPENLVDKVMSNVEPRFDEQDTYIQERLEKIENQVITANAATDEDYGTVRLATQDDVDKGVADDKVLTVKTFLPFKEDLIGVQVDKQRRPIQATVTLSASRWNGSKKQSVVVMGVSANDLVFVAPATDKASRDAWASAGIYAESQKENGIVFVCDTVPSVDVNVNLGVFQNAD